MLVVYYFNFKFAILDFTSVSGRNGGALKESSPTSQQNQVDYPIGGNNFVHPHICH